ncbi:site-2 protease family protein [Phycisphaera mikurensis]|uniref:Peptidase M50 family protein n=1 Tax=Phycisphaera mikurensis (strain NBRC 102666 / KCTC 22515 / FYK2301M01) TaxID=1142394 RepID=I0IH80_PHYMF|nr:site-2 protease family protein [Phycisphaera mikurensis]MBB6440868.1 regulator of sigma E protease [Phycisphaera mikurensis]BAM04618.1 peptidase M50 family protein [Phycisphaera mikurensis NBRC 102666]
MRDLLQNHPEAAVGALILGFGFLIFIHELGHFLVAKWVGIRATQFAIGFGPAVASFRRGIGLRAGSTEAEYEKRARGAAGPDPSDDELYAAADAAGLGETEYRLNWLPLGGYVKMLGQEDLDPAAASQDPRAYNQKAIWKRMLVISAGVVMNLVFGIVFLVLAFGPGAGVAFPAPVVGGVSPGEPAARAYAEGHEGDPSFLGLLPGDRITGLNGDPVEDLVAVKIATALGGRSNDVLLDVERPGEAGGEATPLRFRLRPEVGRTSDSMLAVGIQPATTDEVVGVEEGSVWAEAGVAAGDRLVSVAGTPVDGPAALQRRVARGGGRTVEALFADEAGVEKAVTFAPLPALARDADGGESLLGLEPLAEVNYIVPGSPAEAVGLRAGDVLTRVGGVQWPSRSAVLGQIAAHAASGRAVELAVLREGARVPIEAATLDDGQLGIGYGPASGLARVAASPSPGALSLPAGSLVTSLNGRPLGSFTDLQAALQEAVADAAEPATDVALGFEVPLGAGSVETRTFSLDEPQRATIRGAAWVPPGGLAFRPLKVLIAGASVGEAAAIGLEKTGEFIQQTYVTLLRLFQGDVKVTHLRGPVGIVDEGSRLAREGWPYYLYFLGIISINLAVINFLPLPIVDGGHMVFLAVEKLRGKPAGPQIQTAVTLVGLCLIAAFFVIVTYNDLFRLASRLLA